MIDGKSKKKGCATQIRERRLHKEIVVRNKAVF
jgi:hypothetical protein